MPIPTIGGERFPELREEVREICAPFGDEYYRKMSHERRYPEEWVTSLTKSGLLSALIPKEYGGRGLGLTEASVIMEEINRSGGNAGNCHAQMYNMETLLRHGSDEQKKTYLPRIASGDLRLQSMAVTEPLTGTDTTKTSTSAIKRGDHYVISGEKIWIGRIQHSDLMILLARTAPIGEVKKRSEGLSIFIVDIHRSLGHGMDIKSIDNMVDAETNHVYFDDLEIPSENLIGDEGHGLKYIFDGLDAERTLIAAECIGDGYWFMERAVDRGNERVVFDRPIGQNQGIQFPIAKAFMEVLAADLMRFRACEMFDAGKPAGAEANMAKYLAAKASWRAANTCLQTWGGFAFATSHDIERKFRQTRLYQIAPISTNLILSYIGEHVLGLPRSY